ncbi:MAG: molybdopterin biosynthesis protein, partial [Anaerolineales bacterium]|nr:molybdopterin biosynthesis protein [Anaerolineales bacterium]
TSAAEQVASGLAHAAIGLQAAARQFNLHFIPLFEERFDLVFPRQETDQLAPLLDEIQSTSFWKTAKGLSGYNFTHSGEEITF